MKYKTIGLLIYTVFAAALCMVIHAIHAQLGLSLYAVLSEKIDTAFRIVMIADGHNAVFGEGNQQLHDLVAGQSPDAILVVGDMVNGDEAQTDTAKTLLSALAGIAPTYASYGNHELKHESAFGSDTKDIYDACGVRLLDGEYLDIAIGGQMIRLGGIFGYCLPESALKTGEAKIEECNFLNDFQDTELFTLLMCHMPSGWNTFGGLDAWDIDCIVAGHAHGGQIILPLIGGVYAPDQGWFPGRVHGVFESEAQDSTLIVSRGLGSSVSVPRIGNPPEVVVIDFVPEEF